RPGRASRGCRRSPVPHPDRRGRPRRSRPGPRRRRASARAQRTGAERPPHRVPDASEPPPARGSGRSRHRLGPPQSSSRRRRSRRPAPRPRASWGSKCGRHRSIVAYRFASGDRNRLGGGDVKRRLAVGLVIVLGMLAAVVGATRSYGAKAAPITLTMWSYDNPDPGLEPVLKQLGKQFEQTHSGVKINLIFKDFNSLVGTVPRALGSGSGPDVTEGNEGYQTDAQLVKAKLILPLDKYIKKYHWDRLYSPSTWGMFRWTPDGKSFGRGPIWGLAQTGQNIVAFYNKKK